MFGFPCASTVTGASRECYILECGLPCQQRVLGSLSTDCFANRECSLSTDCLAKESVRFFEYRLPCQQRVLGSLSTDCLPKRVLGSLSIDCPCQKMLSCLG